MMAPEELRWFFKLAFDFSNASEINRIAFDGTMRKLEAECLKRRAERSDEESQLSYPRAVKRRAIPSLMQSTQVQNVNSALADATVTGNEKNIDEDKGLAGPWVGPRSSSSLNELRKKEYICCND